MHDLPLISIVRVKWGPCVFVCNPISPKPIIRTFLYYACARCHGHKLWTNGNAECVYYDDTITHSRGMETVVYKYPVQFTIHASMSFFIDTKHCVSLLCKLTNCQFVNFVYCESNRMARRKVSNRRRKSAKSLTPAKRSSLLCCIMGGKFYNVYTLLKPKRH